MRIVGLGLVATLVLCIAPSGAQLPPEAVDLALVKIPERLTSEDLCPVHLVPSDPAGETWTHAGGTYRGHESGDKKGFLKDPDTLAKRAERERWIENFKLAMSSIWCPITDEVTPGGRKQVEGLGYTWESCCSFCDDEMVPENFEEAEIRLSQRAEESYDLSGGVYHNDASSPVEGAIKDDF